MVVAVELQAAQREQAAAALVVLVVPLEARQRLTLVAAAAGRAQMCHREQAALAAAA